ncbi:hypothetical protein [Streptomyces californicus]
MRSFRRADVHQPAGGVARPDPDVERRHAWWEDLRTALRAW